MAPNATFASVGAHGLLRKEAGALKVYMQQLSEGRDQRRDLDAGANFVWKCAHSRRWGGAPGLVAPGLSEATPPAAPLFRPPMHPHHPCAVCTENWHFRRRLLGCKGGTTKR